MPATIAPPDLGGMGVGERVELLGRVWDSLLADGGPPPVPAWHAEELARRIAHADANPGEGVPLEEFRAELLRGRP